MIMEHGKPHIAIVGAGIIGLAAAYHLDQMGASVTLIDRDLESDGTSFGNAGGIAVTEVMPASARGVAWRVPGWIADPLGPLAIRPVHAPRLLPWLARFARSGTTAEVVRISQALSSLNTRTYGDLAPILRDTGLSGDLRPNGALSLYETPQGERRDRQEWARKRALGVIAEDISGAEARRLEPALGPRVHSAVWTPQWSNLTDPGRLMGRLTSWLAGRGVIIRQGEVQDISASGLRLADGGVVDADQVVVATGAWSARLARQLGDRVLLESERGYTMTVPSPGLSLTRELVFAERKFVAAPLECGLRIGGAAEFGGLCARPNFRRSQALAKLAGLYLPDLRIEGGVCWAGHRPTTPDSLPVISRSTRRANLFYAFGHGHLGLTQAATTGRLIGEMVFGRTTSIDVAPFSIARFA